MRTKYIDLLEQAGRIFLTMGDTFFDFVIFPLKKNGSRFTENPVVRGKRGDEKSSQLKCFETFFLEPLQL